MESQSFTLCHELAALMPLTVRCTTGLSSAATDNHFSRGYVVYTANQAEGFQYNDARSGQEAVGMFMGERFPDLVQYEKPETGVYINDAQLGDMFFYSIRRNFYATSHANKDLKRYGLVVDTPELRQQATNLATQRGTPGWVTVCTEVDTNGRGRLAIIGDTRTFTRNNVRYDIAYIFGAQLNGSRCYVNLAPFDSRNWYGLDYVPDGVIDWSTMLN